MTRPIETFPSTIAPSLIERIDALLPQTQCGKCGHPGCKPYARGIAAGEPINRCPPGGDETIAQLAGLLQVPVVPLDLERGPAPAQVAYIREAECIGCTKCIQACPVDAIVGAAKLMHTVLIDECTGCDLCVAPCPVDCIEMHPLVQGEITPIIGGIALTPDELVARAKKRNHARQRFEARNARLQREQHQHTARIRKPSPASVDQPLATLATPTRVSGDDEAIKKARIALAMSRAQLNKSLQAFGHPPIAEQAARLLHLQQEFEAAERILEDLLATTPKMPTPTAAKGDASGIKRAKIQLAMARAAVSKAQVAQAPADELAQLHAQLRRAEQAMEAAEQSLVVSNNTQVES